MYAYISEEYKKDIYEAQKNYIIAKAYHETMELIEKDSKTTALQEVPFYDKNNKRVLDYKTSYTIADDKEAIKFYKLVHEKRLKLGFKVNLKCVYEGYKEDEPYFLTTTYLSFDLLKKAENTLITVAHAALPEHLQSGIKLDTLNGSFRFKQEFINIIMKFDTGYEYNVKNMLTGILK